MQTILLEIIDGNDRGKKFRAAEGVRLGRSTGEIILNDSKVSSLHAIIEADPKGLTVVDLNSSNGLKVDGHLVKRVRLMPGVIFQVGRTYVRVNFVEAEDADRIVPLPAKVQDWRDSLEFWVSQAPHQNTQSEPMVWAFTPPLRLQFLEGIQADQEIILGFGPRKAGSDVLDLDLFEEAAPPLAFELIPEEGGARFQTAFPQLVKLNDAATTSHDLEDGDLIRVGKTVIRVNFMRDIT